MARVMNLIWAAVLTTRDERRVTQMIDIQRDHRHQAVLIRIGEACHEAHEEVGGCGEAGGGHGGKRSTGGQKAVKEEAWRVTQIA